MTLSMKIGGTFSNGRVTIQQLTLWPLELRSLLGIWIITIFKASTLYFLQISTIVIFSPFNLITIFCPLSFCINLTDFIEFNYYCPWLRPLPSARLILRQIHYWRPNCARIKPWTLITVSNQLLTSQETHIINIALHFCNLWLYLNTLDTTLSQVSQRLRLIIVWPIGFRPLNKVFVLSQSF